MQTTSCTGSKLRPQGQGPPEKGESLGTQTISNRSSYRTTAANLMKRQAGFSVDISLNKVARAASLLVAALLLAAVPGSSFAQSQPSQGAQSAPQAVTTQGGFSYSPAIPTGEFGDALGRTSQGVGLYLGVKAGSLPLYLGLDLDVGQYGSEKRDVSTGFVDGTFETTSNLYQPHVSARYQPESGRFRPFVEGLVGANVLSTSTTWSDFGTTVEAPQDVDKTSVAFSAGAGLGADLRLARVKPLGILGLTGSFYYLYGSEAEVPIAEGVAVADGQLSTAQTNTSVLQPEIGLYFEF